MLVKRVPLILIFLVLMVGGVAASSYEDSLLFTIGNDWSVSVSEWIIEIEVSDIDGNLLDIGLTRRFGDNNYLASPMRVIKDGIEYDCYSVGFRDESTWWGELEALKVIGTFSCFEEGGSNALFGKMLIEIMLDDGCDIGEYSQPCYVIASSGADLYLRAIDFESSGLETRVESLEDNQEGQETRISTLESWKLTITDTINDILDSITALIVRVEDDEDRIEELENQNFSIGCEECTNEYLTHLSSSDRKRMVCGYAEENHLYSIVDLGWNCTITYKETSRGERASCRCRRL